MTITNTLKIILHGCMNRLTLAQRYVDHTGNAFEQIYSKLYGEIDIISICEFVSLYTRR
jgi:hypothetical protein